MRCDRFPAAARERPSATTTATTITTESKPDVHFRRPPGNRSQIYQLCDIEDSAIQGVVENEVRSEAIRRLETPVAMAIDAEGQFDNM
ncbi:hypothetical protein Pmar_PMAR011640 [Perkinsus marinus ATCC 50983]|uniref:Uncharacterized protein n=1 Tax=Perkinsus marinus (strain ATCC 50983 / TXsc) TaxID=423536 RepID=C5LCC6_PERM5|nr:hypothetical protein Pmar_PMAR011640 [Perkinsus marinus ATCC 50983]EER05609.1 hypothetical protein Pmar_PMAR011640 [Perkinsus marinus ATCC 50983]|eukprot:XP_002773793.1 hypothetical protein Pmar_PMAR011640 [Perkinsus marinus ATCC 50983]